MSWQNRLKKTAQLLCASVLIISLFPTAAPAALIKPARLRIVIDPGHGGGYSGAVYGGIAEKTLNLMIAKRVANELRSRGHDVALTRYGDSYVYSGGKVPTWKWVDSEDAYVYDYWSVKTATDRLKRDLQSRCDRANLEGADLFVSIHNNAGGSASGSESYRAPNDPLGQAFADDVQRGLVNSTGSKNRGVHSANFYVIRWSNMPAVLVECGFMSNPSELGRLRSTSYQARIADGIADGIERFARRGVNEEFDRLWGSDRYSTAAAVARAGWSSPDTVILASGETFADSLVAGPYAAQLDAPIVLTAARGLPASTHAVLRELAPSKIVVVGGPVSVPGAVVNSAASAAGIPASSVRRIGGADRYAVALNVAEEMGVADDAPVIVASGEVFPDALSISGKAAENGEPILLASSKHLPGATRAYITRDSRQMTVVGGPRTIPDSVLSGLYFERLAGSDRYATNWSVYTGRYEETQQVQPMIASGEVFPDALVLGPYAAKQGRPILLMGKTSSSRNLRPFIYDHRDDELDVDIVGGPASVSAYVSYMFEKWRMNKH
jgi:N-acetylmuramoyl-L-alanine amidase